VLRAPCFQGQQAWLREVRCPDTMKSTQAPPNTPGGGLGACPTHLAEQDAEGVQACASSRRRLLAGACPQPSRVRKFAPKYLGTPLDEITGYHGEICGSRNFGQMDMGSWTHFWYISGLYRYLQAAQKIWNRQSYPNTSQHTWYL
jgi:hypothetical protein